MDVRIGITTDGQAAGFDTSSARPLLLVADVGRGKTTTARYITRRWLANTRRHAHVYAAPIEWADLPCKPEHPDQLNHPVGRKCRPRPCLVAVDDMAPPDAAHPPLLPLGPARPTLPSHGATSIPGRTPPAGDIPCLGLVRPAPAGPAEAA